MSAVLVQIANVSAVLVICRFFKASKHMDENDILNVQITLREMPNPGFKGRKSTDAPQFTGRSTLWKKERFEMSYLYAYSLFEKF